MNTYPAGDKEDGCAVTGERAYARDMSKGSQAQFRVGASVDEGAVVEVRRGSAAVGWKEV